MQIGPPHENRAGQRAALGASLPERVLVVFALLAANLRKVAAFVAEEADIASGATRRLPTRRRTRELSYRMPDLPRSPSTRGPTPGPDPPLTA